MTRYKKRIDRGWVVKKKNSAWCNAMVKDVCLLWLYQRCIEKVEFKDATYQRGFTMQTVKQLKHNLLFNAALQKNLNT